MDHASGGSRWGRALESPQRGARDFSTDRCRAMACHRPPAPGRRLWPAPLPQVLGLSDMPGKAHSASRTSAWRPAQGGPDQDQRRDAGDGRRRLAPGSGFWGRRGGRARSRRLWRLLRDRPLRAAQGRRRASGGASRGRGGRSLQPHMGILVSSRAARRQADLLKGAGRRKRAR